MKTITILMTLVLIISFGLVQKVSQGQEIPAFTTNNAITVNGSDLLIQYGMTGGKLVSINADISSKSLIILIQSTGNGILNMTLPRTLIDAKQNVDDTHFTVLVNNHGINYDEIASYAHRTLSIPFRLGSEKIQIIGTQMLTQTSNSSANLHQVIEAPYTNNPPDIDGKWSWPSEWNESKTISVERNGSEMYILAQHDVNFVYIMTDIVSDHTTPSSYPFMRYDFLMHFDTGNYQRDTISDKEIAIGKSLTFINGTQISSNFGSEVWTYDNQSNVIDVAPPLGYNSSIGFSSINDPFDSSHDHRVYELKIPFSLLHQSNKYGFSLQAHACASGIVGIPCKSIYFFTWPSGAIMSVPVSHGILELTSGNSVPQPPEATTPINFQLYIVGIIIAGSITGLVAYKIVRSRKISSQVEKHSTDMA